MSVLVTEVLPHLLATSTSSSSDSNSSGGALLLLLAGPAAGIGMYWALFRYYRNTDKSNAFERNTKVDAHPVQGEDQKVDEIRGTRSSTTDGHNQHAYRHRVQRVP